MTCNDGYYRYHDGNNIVSELQNWLDFLDQSTSFYNEYKTYFMTKYNLISYIPNTKSSYDGNSQCIMCPPGYYCTSGSTSPTPCPPGSYCENQFSSSSKCPQGYYNNLNKQYKCLECPLGSICPLENMTTPSDCPQGYICNSTKIGTLEKSTASYNSAVK